MAGTERVLRRVFVPFAVLVGCVFTVSCGGSDAPAYAAFAHKCAAPAAGETQGTLNDEKIWLRAWTDDLYLWYREVPSYDPAGYPSAIAYFNALKTTALTPSGNPKDKFHFTIPTAEWQSFSTSGVSVGYGIEWAIVKPKMPRDVRVGYVAAGSPGGNANMARGTQIMAVDGVRVLDGDAAAINAGLGPSDVGETHNFSVIFPGTTSEVPVSLTAQSVQSNPVPVSGKLTGTSVGYILFNDHIATSENLLAQAISNLRSQGITDLVLDIRYNGGGYLAIASELAYMISGPSTTGKAFETLSFNDKHPTNDPVTGQLLTPTPFLSTGQGFSVSRNTPLPTLGLSRVFVLTDGGTCSASESIINGLRGQNINVVQIGFTTCGKPYGFYPADKCGTTYFSIQFKGVNAKGFGDYPDGFTPAGTDPAGVPGCLVAEGFDHELSDPAEARISAALQYIANGTCPPLPAIPTTALSVAATGSDTLVAKPPWRENRIVLRNR